MGEKAKSIGEKLEGFGENLFKDLGWQELARDKEIKCIKVQHKNKKQNSKKTHGIDLLHSHYDSYRGQAIGVITECKNRTWAGISPSTINSWAEELLNTIECSQNSLEVCTNISNNCSINTGILLIYCNDGQFNKDKFYDYLTELNCPIRRNPINIFMAGNDRIDQWNSLLKKIRTDYSDNFKFVYPSIDNNSIYNTDSCLTANHLFSKFVFGVREYYQESFLAGSSLPTKIPCKQYIIFSFDDCNNDAFKYIYSIFKRFQFESADEYIFCFYPQKSEDIDFTRDNFVKATASLINQNKKIKVDFMENRSLGPVDYAVKG